MQTDRTIPVENTDPDQMDTLEDNILSDQMDISDDDQMDWQVEEPLAPGMTNLQIESCLKGYPATVCCADELPLHVGVKSHTFIVNTDTFDRGGSHWVAFHFPLVGPAEFFDSLGNAPETYHLCFANFLIDRQLRTAILLLFVSNPTRRHRHMRTVLSVLLQLETSRKGAARHSERRFPR